MNRIICFDTETTGFNYSGGDRVIEIGAVEILDGKITGNNFHAYINPEGKMIPPDAYMVHKLSNEFLGDKPTMRETAPKLLDFIGESMVVAHNGFDFDFPFINHELSKLGLPTIPRNRQDDTIVIARNRVFGPKEFSLDALAKWFGISTAARAEAHGALIDAEILARLYLELATVAPSESIEDIIEKHAAACAMHPKIGADFPRRNFIPTDTELEVHDDFVKNNIKDSIWLN
ncbi:MAG: exonuclease domain-containing protein [Alphaproteobacteria bacterium]|nr:exonuclease domain-containing protein [Alphaproteobacteria bacterium]MCL2890077.1 exonuclease domain-containing protein [Alphaproteobacteria bacterium]